MAHTLILVVIFLSLCVDFTYSGRGCSPGNFGWKCKFQCACRRGPCDKNTGWCESGCQEGKYGVGCQLLNECLYDSQGVNYTGTLGVGNEGKKCISWSDPFVQGEGYTLDKFPPGDNPKNYCRNPKNNYGKYGVKPWCFFSTLLKKNFVTCGELKPCSCPDGLFGAGCQSVCHCRTVDEVCNKLFGSCTSGCAAGWTGLNCQRTCPEGKYGQDCAQTCGHCYQKSCDPEYGECQKNCEEGYSGLYCTDKCPNSRYGRNCEGECGKCKDGEPCNKNTGFCFRGCSNGYKGYKCDEKCPPGLYGKSCKLNCGYCKFGSTCDHVTGTCLSGCQAGKMGDNCTTDCEDGHYGENCSFACGSCKFGKPCLAKTGQCMDGCSDGFLGYQCAEAVEALEEGKITGGIVAAVVIVIIVIILILAFVLYRKRRHKRMDVSNPLPLDPREAENNGHSESARLLSDSRVGDVTRLDQDENGGSEEINEPIYVNINSKKQTSPVKLVDLADYIKKHRENNCLGFKQEFEELPMGLLALCEVARRADNKAKNRYGNIVAYDHSRVTLDPMTSEANSDYVNANFMDGYSKQHQYIASQGPNKAMIRDFWRMVWQQRVCKVVMLTNLVEACKKKCEQYWPEEGGIKYGEVTVRIVDTAKYTDYTIRTFEISQLEISRIVKQFHFTTWSDHGAPTYPTTLLAFRRKVQMYNPESSAPILCHCSAGIGRTGTYIALDYLLEQAQKEDQVDVLCIAQLMRTNRVNMIQTWEQYAFVYDAVLEAVKSGETTIAKSAFRSTYQNMLSAANEGDPNKLEEQYQVLQTLSPTVERSECSAAFAEDNMNKNRFKNILPANRCRPFLYTPVDNCTDYINAVFLPGCTQKDRFIVTQMPLPNTVADFWRMLYDYTSDTIIMLNEFDRNDKSCALYWPEEYGYTEEYGPLNVELLSSSEADPDVTIRIFKLSHLVKGEERAVKQFMFKSWPDYQTVPNSRTALLRLHKLTTDWLKQNGKGPVTIHCMNGASKSGMFAAISLVLERLSLDQELDVYQTVKQIRINRPQFIENYEQYQFCYQLIMEYLDSQE
ncbi:receptor-type tyrosine-protein phosphatase kappa-like isoform X1 [Haliotis rufescens]|uniref:receptor-type tyrosine-protein phosphatase kappa-like isoform X1 n=1 Tax=Haliotis rufescens TaxID=6454 RepID=UPI00201F63A1|nr:receptor-type tyrosine-protein phosphatase kappa-like isoform X1 [Haliotis rufescens]